MRHWCAVARLTRTKKETGTFDRYPVKNWLGHERMATTEGYIRYAEQYYSRAADWIACALKSQENTVAGMHKENGYKGEVRQNAFFGPVETPFSC